MICLNYQLSKRKRKKDPESGMGGGGDTRLPKTTHHSHTQPPGPSPRLPEDPLVLGRGVTTPGPVLHTSRRNFVLSLRRSRVRVEENGLRLSPRFEKNRILRNWMYRWWSTTVEIGRFRSTISQVPSPPRPLKPTLGPFLWSPRPITSWP